MNKILPIILVVVLSGCSSEPTHYFKCDAIKEHKDRYYNFHSIYSSKATRGDYSSGLINFDYPPNTVYFKIENNKLKTINDYYVTTDYEHNHNTDFEFTTFSFASSLSEKERQHGTTYKAEERLYLYYKFDRVSKELTVAVKYKVHSKDKTFGYPDGKLKECDSTLSKFDRYPCYYEEYSKPKPGSMWDKGGITYTPFLKYTYFPNERVNSTMMVPPGYTKKYKCIKRPDL